MSQNNSSNKKQAITCTEKYIIYTKTKKISQVDYNKDYTYLYIPL